MEKPHNNSSVERAGELRGNYFFLGGKSDKIYLMKKVALVANTSWYLFIFRLEFIFELRRSGYEVVLVAPEDKYSPRLRELGLRLYTIPLVPRGTNPIREFMTALTLARVYRIERPTLVHHYTVKCCLYGSLAAWPTRGA